MLGGEIRGILLGAVVTGFYPPRPLPIFTRLYLVSKSCGPRMQPVFTRVIKVCLTSEGLSVVDAMSVKRLSPPAYATSPRSYELADFEHPV